MSKTPYRKPGERPSVPRELRRWYTKSGDVEKGPYEAAAIRTSLKEGHLRPTTLVRAEDETEWRPASEVTDITRGAAPRAKPPAPPVAPIVPADDGSSKTLVYGALACGLTYVGLVFGILGIRLARRQLRDGPGKHTRTGYMLSVVGVCIQLALLVAAVVVIVLTNKGVLH